LNCGPRGSRGGSGAALQVTTADMGVQAEVIATRAPTPPAQTRVALVTGSSCGLGSAIARRLGQDGLAVAVNDARGGTGALEVANAIRADGGVADAFTADVSDERQAVELVAAVARSLGHVDVLVLNATGPQPEAPLAQVAWEDHVGQPEFFVQSPVLLARAVLPGMQERRFGRIVQIDSEVVDRPRPAGRPNSLPLIASPLPCSRAPRRPRSALVFARSHAD
jgi:NAD(P)-dependent dehydrogenase (short-subunit alcohol dehydrogenase family)